MLWFMCFTMITFFSVILSDVIYLYEQRKQKFFISISKICINKKVNIKSNFQLWETLTLKARRELFRAFITLTFLHKIGKITRDIFIFNAEFLLSKKRIFFQERKFCDKMRDISDRSHVHRAQSAFLHTQHKKVFYKKINSSTDDFLTV